MNRDAKFINFSEEHELDYILKKYGKETIKENRDLLKEFGKKAKEFLGKTMKRNTPVLTFHCYCSNFLKKQML